MITIFTIKVIYQTENPRLFGIDFDSKSHIVISYSTLIGAVLTFLSIVFLLFTIIQQHEQFTEEKELKKYNIKRDRFDRLKLVNNLLIDTIKHIRSTGKELEKFIDLENKKPLDTHILPFYANKNYYRLLDMDFLTVFQSFQTHYNTENWEEVFNNTYRKVDYYTEALSEIKESSKLHINDKAERKKEISFKVNSIMNYSANTLLKYKKTYPDDYESIMGFKILNDFVLHYHELLKQDEATAESDLEKISNDLLQTFLLTAIHHQPEPTFDNDYENIINQVSSIRKQIWTIKFETQAFIENLNKSFEKYFSDKSEYFIELQKIQNNLNEIINKDNG